MTSRFRTYLVGIGILLTSTLSLISFTNTASAVVDSPRCTVTAVGARANAFTVKDNVATVKFEVSGPADCRVKISANSFYAPTLDGRPYDKQTLFERVTKTYKPGTYSLSVNLPEKSTEAKGCFHQVDLTYGTHNVTPVLAYGHGKLDCNQQQPEFKCVDLKVVETSRTKRTFTAKTTASDGAKIVAYEFGFGDGMGITVAEKSYLYEYKEAGTYDTSVVVHVEVNGTVKKVTSPACKESVTIVPETLPPLPPPTPEPCPYNTTLPKESPQCVQPVEMCVIENKTQFPKDSVYCREDTVTPASTTPEVIVKTGPEALAMGGLGLGSLTAAGYYWGASRRNLLAKFLNRQ